MTELNKIAIINIKFRIFIIKTMAIINLKYENIINYYLIVFLFKKAF